jgi:ribonuclease HI
MIEENALNIFTDGSSYSHPRTGGVGILYVTIGSDGNEIITEGHSFGYKSATNNQMELQACVAALDDASHYFDLSAFQKIIIFTDSQYVTENYFNALAFWSRNKWKNRDGKAVANPKIWKALIKAAKKTGKRVEFKWVKGHSKNVHNKAVDKMAKKSAKGALRGPLSSVSVRRKFSAKSVEVGSVKMLGQRILIRIISTEYMNAARVYRCKFEVMSKRSPYFENVDFICSREVVKDGHTYGVKLNADQKNPMIAKVLRHTLLKKKPRSLTNHGNIQGNIKAEPQER